MKYAFSLILSIFLMSLTPVQAQIPNSKAIHREMHSRLLANANNGIDKRVIQDYIKGELEVKEKSNSEYGELSSESIAMIHDLLDEANSHTGKRYRSGAKGPNNFDCSGFTSYVYKQFGYSISPSSSTQFYEGVEVAKGDLRPGDLVFFKGRNSKSAVGHVGIVVNADNEKHTFNFIHSATSSGIRVDSSTAPYYQKRYVGAKRIITE